MIYNNHKFIQQFIDKLFKYWKRLQKRYNTKVQLMIVDSLTYAQSISRASNSSKEYSIDAYIKLLDQYKNKGFDTQSIAMTMVQYITNVNNSNCWNVELIVVIPKDIIFQLLLENIMRLDKLYDLFKIILRHEMGHVIYFTHVINNESDFELYLNNELEVYRTECNKLDTISSNMSAYEYNKLYNNIRLEKIANDNVGLSYKDFNRVEKYLTECQFDINYIKE